LTGICSVNVDRNHIPDTFNILLGSPNNVMVLAKPAWWTLRTTLVVLALLAGLTLVIGVWVVVLRRRVVMLGGRCMLLTRLGFCVHDMSLD